MLPLSVPRIEMTTRPMPTVITPITTGAIERSAHAKTKKLIPQTVITAPPILVSQIMTSEKLRQDIICVSLPQAANGCFATVISGSSVKGRGRTETDASPADGLAQYLRTFLRQRRPPVQ
jgi:hypothetical protein